MRKLKILLLFIFPLIVNSQNLLNKLNVDSIKGLGGEVYYPMPDMDYNAKSYTISGVVINPKGNVMPLATIEVNGKFYGTTNSDGKFTISLKTNKSAEVSISNSYYNCLTFVVDKKYNDKTFIIKLNTRADYNPNVLVRKPAIYLYPERKQEITIKNDFKGQLQTLYPAYNVTDGWKVIADSDGRIYNPSDKRNYGYLFWDGTHIFGADHFNYKSGFYVDKINYSSFLLEKLTHVGLNETEINDFIVYWLPVLNNYDKIFIHFWINDNIDGSSRLTVTPEPDTMIRLFMEFGKYEGEAKLPEQDLPQIERKKFTLVEWGGGEIGTNELR